MLSLLKKIIPRPLVKIYHYLLAVAANFFYGSPSDKLVVIGVTGTSGKSTTVYLITKILEKAGFKVGAASTILFKVDKKEKVNDKKMTMVGRFALQKLIKQMAQANCQYAVIETSSQGIEQFRHLGINYDVLVFTNLYPEHIEAHGSFENYKKAKLKLFKKLENERSKLLSGKKVPKVIIANLDDQHAEDFLNFQADQKFGFTLTNASSSQARVIRAEPVAEVSEGISFSVDHQPFILKIFGRHNIYNCLAAITVGLSQGLQLGSMSDKLKGITGVPGRIEFINIGQSFQVIVDYAFEPKAVAALYETVNKIPHQKVIHVLGSTGGGRDKARRPKLGELAGKNSNFVFVTNEDPYDEDPQVIIDQVAAGGKGSEQAIVVKNNKKIPWDDRKVVKEELDKTLNSKQITMVQTTNYKVQTTKF